MRRWHVGEVTRQGLRCVHDQDDTEPQVAAAVFAAGLGFEVYVPLTQRYRRMGSRIIESTVPRFGAYVFTKFDRSADNWGDLLRGHGPVTSHFRRILCTSAGIPVPVPDEAIAAVRAYSPVPLEEPSPIRYRPGQRIIHTMAGIRREAVFVAYVGNRPMIRMWIFGAERVAEASVEELEPLTLA